MNTKAHGLTRKLCPVTFEGADHILYGGEAVYSSEGGRVVGRIRSAGCGYTIGKTIGYTYLPMELAQVGTQIVVVDGIWDVPAVLDDINARLARGDRP